MTDEIFEFCSAQGTSLRGILTIPESITGAPLLLLPAGLKYRVGPGRLYIYIARWFAGRGHPVLRFDPQGLGESDGVIESGRTLDYGTPLNTGVLLRTEYKLGMLCWKDFQPLSSILAVCAEAQSRLNL